MNVKVTALTGATATLIGGSTVHSTFKISDDIDTGNLRKKVLPGSYSQQLISGYDVVIVDEVLMMSGQLYNNLNKVCQQSNMVASKRTESFAGKTIIFFGDFYQLPPVLSKKERRLRGYGNLLENKHFERNFTWFFLTENKRQDKDPIYADLLEKVRTGKCSGKDLDILKTKEVVGRVNQLHMLERSDVMILSSTNEIREQYNHHKLQKELTDQEMLVFKAKHFREEIDAEKKKLKFTEINEDGEDYGKIMALVDKWEEHHKVAVPKSVSLKIGCPLLVTRNINT